MAKHHSKRARPAGEAPPRARSRQSKSATSVLGYHWACGRCLKNPLDGFSHRRFPTDVAAMAAGKLHKQRHHQHGQDVLIMVAPATSKSSFNKKLGIGPFFGKCSGCEFRTDPNMDFNEAEDLAVEHCWTAHPDEPDIIVDVDTARS